MLASSPPGLPDPAQFYKQFFEPGDRVLLDLAQKARNVVRVFVHMVGLNGEMASV